MRPFFSGLFALALSAPALAQHAPHAHGVAELRVAVEGARLDIEFQSPLDNLVGFEHAPRSASQRAALAKAEETLRRVEALFVLPPAAACVVKSVELDSPYPQGEPATEARPGAKPVPGEAHADMRVSYALECANPQALKELGLRLTEVFPRIRRIRAETATPAGQGAVTLDKSRRALPL